MRHSQVVRSALSMKRIAFALVCAGSLSLAARGLTSRAAAQDMSFDMKETGQNAAPPAEGPPSEALANALRLYQEDRHQEAAVQLQRIVEGESKDAPGNQQKAQFSSESRSTT
jgi:hypothetical protein